MCHVSLELHDIVSLDDRNSDIKPFTEYFISPDLESVEKN